MVNFFDNVKVLIVPQPSLLEFRAPVEHLFKFATFQKAETAAQQPVYANTPN